MDEDLYALLGLGDRLDEGVGEGSEDVADRHAIGATRPPDRISPDGEREEGVVGRPPVQRLDERRELGGDPPVDLDDRGRSVEGTTNSILKKPPSNPSAGRTRPARAIHMCQEAGLSDSAIRELCDGIIRAQRQEIAEMERIIERRR